MSLILDGAMGTELNRRGVNTELPLWTADSNILYPDLVQSIHEDYIQSGADIITTNTFRTTSWTYKRAGYTDIISEKRAKKSLYSAVECAHKASKGSVKIAGSITSLNDCYIPSNFPGRNVAIDVYGQTLDWLIDSGVDVILFETMGSFEEIDVALSLSSKYEKPIWLSVIMKDAKLILDGTPIEKILLLANHHLVEAFLFNCNNLYKTILSLKNVQDSWEGMFGTYPNLGIKDYSDEYFDVLSKKKFTDEIKNILKFNPSIIGCCCGSSPYHIKILKEQIRRN